MYKTRDPKMIELFFAAKKGVEELRLINQIIDQSIEIIKKQKDLIETKSTEFDFLGLNFKVKLDNKNIIFELPCIFEMGSYDFNHNLVLFLKTLDVIDSVEVLLPYEGWFSQYNRFPEYLKIWEKYNNYIKFRIIAWAEDYSKEN